MSFAEIVAITADEWRAAFDVCRVDDYDKYEGA